MFIYKKKKNNIHVPTAVVKQLVRAYGPLVHHFVWVCIHMNVCCVWCRHLCTTSIISSVESETKVFLVHVYYICNVKILHFYNVFLYGLSVSEADFTLLFL